MCADCRGRLATYIVYSVAKVWRRKFDTPVSVLIIDNGLIVGGDAGGDAGVRPDMLRRAAASLLDRADELDDGEDPHLSPFLKEKL